MTVEELTGGPEVLGDMDPETFHRSAIGIADWIRQYLNTPEDYPVLSRVAPGDVTDALPTEAPERGEPMERILNDFKRILVPGLTHWNHPGFLGYFSTSGSGPGVLAEFLTAALNQQAMLWRTSPAATELEEVTLGWLRSLLGLPGSFEGVIYDGGSASNLHALMAAREAAVPGVRARGLAHRAELPPMRVYCSEQAHSSIDKAVIVLGLGHQALRKIPVDDEYRLRPDLLKAAIAEDRAAGFLPIAVVATVGTTGTASVDPVDAIVGICQTMGVWLHVDASYAGPAAMVPEHAWIFAGVPEADSFVVNPHKWLFTPLDISAFYTRHMDVLRRALALTPEYLETSEADSSRNLMDTGVALGRRFRALKLWMVLRYFGAQGLRARITEHMRLAQLFTTWVDGDSDFERLAPTTLSVVCFRAAPAGVHPDQLKALNAEILDRVNASGEVFLSHTRLRGRFTLRLAVGQIRTREAHVARAWELLRDSLAAARGESLTFNQREPERTADVRPMSLEGERIRLESMLPSHLEALTAIGLEPALWERTTIRVRTADEMAQYIQTALDAQSSGVARPFVIVLKQTGEIIGATRYHSIVPAHRRLEIGFTWISLSWQRLAINTESKYLLLEHAFEHLGCQRVEFKADSQNEPSCRALRSIGAREEGILRSYMVSADRGSRDLVLFSIIAPEWPGVKARLQEALERRPQEGRA